MVSTRIPPCVVHCRRGDLSRAQTTSRVHRQDLVAVQCTQQTGGGVWDGGPCQYSRGEVGAGAVRLPLVPRKRDRPGNSIRSLGITADRDLLERKRGGFVSDNHLGIARGRKACSVLSVNADPATQVAVECIT